MTDEQFFLAHPDRQARIRLPEGKIHTDPKTRQARVVTEYEGEFWSLGPHDRSRRRVLVWRTAKDHPTHPNHILPMPFLLFADETVEDNDETLLPIIHELMMERRGK